MGDVDPRINFLQDYVLKSMNLKVDKWSKMIGNDDQKNLIVDWLEKRHIMKLVFYLTPAGQLTAEYESPPSSKTKGCFFIKRSENAVPRENIGKLVNFGDITQAPLEHLSAVIDVINTILNNPGNNALWPKVVSAEVRSHGQKLENEVYEITGSIKGRTMLPMPSGIDNINAEGDNSAILHKVEGIVIKWVHQVKNVLDLKSGQAIIDGKNPGPNEELKFWSELASNLQCIYDQLVSPKVQKMARMLKDKESSYYQSLVNMFDDVRIHLEEARDISMHLKPLRTMVDDIEQTDLSEIEPRFRCLYHLCALIWKSSDHYRTPARIVVLLQELANFVIELVKGFLDPENIFKSEIDDANEQIKVAVQVLSDFKSLFFEYRKKLPEYFDGDTPMKAWDFKPSLVFARFDKFTHRVHMISDFFVNSAQMIALEKVEIGGIRGSQLTAKVVKIYEEFLELHATQSAVAYDTLDPEDTRFDSDYAKFKETLFDMDRRLGTILCSAFNDCSSVENMFKLLAIAGNLIERPLIKSKFDPKYQLLLNAFDCELDEVKCIFDADHDEPPIHKNQPPVAGRLKWANELHNRIAEIHKNFAVFPHPTFETADAKIIEDKYQQMVSLIKQYKIDVYAGWTSRVDDDCKMNLSQPLIVRNQETNLIDVNFDKRLQAVLREVKYLKFMSEDEIPASAASLFERHDVLRLWVSCLDQMVNWYNKIRNTVLDVEFPLIEKQLAVIDEQLKSGENELNWSMEVLDYIMTTYDLIKNLEQQLQEAKDNVTKIDSIMDGWSESPLFVRKVETKAHGLLSLNDRQDRVKTRYNLITQNGEQIHKLIAENAVHFQADTTTASWHAYISSIDDMIISGFFRAIERSMDYLQENMSANVAPLFAAELELRPPETAFTPSLAEKSVDGFYDLIEGLLEEIYDMSNLIPRVAISDNTYRQIMAQNDDLSDLRSDIITHVYAAMKNARDYAGEFDEFSHLWNDDRAEFLSQFLTYGHILTAEEIEAAGTEPIPENPPKLQQFKSQIDSYEDLYTQISQFPDTSVFQSWFRISIKPFKHALLNLIKKWSFMFKDHLVHHVEDSLSDLQSFIADTAVGLKQKTEEGDFDGLVNIMGYIIAVKERGQNTDNMFGPLKDTIDLLKKYQLQMPEKVHQQLTDLPEKWSQTKKASDLVRQDVAPLQAIEVAGIRRKATSFEVKQHEHRERFRKLSMFKFVASTPYSEINDAHKELIEMEAYEQELRETAQMFEVNVQEFKQMKASRRDVLLVKEVWDLNKLVCSSMEEWTKTLWADINVENMENDAKRFAKEIRTINKEARGWDVFCGLETQVKNMLTSLRVVAELQNPSIRDRHWHQLMKATGVRFEMTDKTNLNDLLKLNLHEHEDTVREIVDKSVKEMGMEKMLKELEATWAVMEFEHDQHGRTGTCLLRSSEELVETLEDNQVQLQNLMTSKYIAHFLEEVSGWQKRLSTTDSVMTIWLEVQRTWSYLESIFIGSEDIRKQLPEDSLRFDGIDSDFKAIMNEAANVPNVVKATNKPGLFEALESMQDRLTLCEKSLAEYLETKRLAFPRFYFVSSTDLLDILSNGNNPVVIATHLAKLFDNTTDLKFKENSKIAVGMYSSEREYVEFEDECDCDGQVEVWLNRVMDSMRAAIRSYLSDSVITYEEKAREKWLFDYAAQVALTTTQIWWTTEVGIVFSRLEEGYENSMKDYSKKQIQQLNNLITLLLGDLSKGDRQKIMTICTIDVHARDVVLKMIQMKTDSAGAFTWQSQLRARWSDVDSHAYINICDAQFLYSYEYLGNTPRLVVTPLTDRCYITLTQSLHLIMGGAPAGPAGTGKTETTKDLGRALGIMVYVFNCSEQMDYKSVGNIYKGLAQTGAWGCFDEFNRISVEVLSVVAVQVKCIQDAIRDKKKRFVFEGCDISLVPSVGIFITMNPGYAGRTELPENLKALFRPCAMVVPDFELIAENMLLAEGFLEAKYLAKKFITLYTLCKELLSKQDHYDWGLRAIKSVLVVAGALKRSDRGRPEDQVLMRALRDFNVPKIVTEDMPVFLGLIGDLFPSMDVPRKRVPELEKMVQTAVLDLKLQAEESFCLKVVQLEELLNVRHSVFVIGNAGTGKSQILKSLNRTYYNMKQKPVCVDLNPKSVTNDELFGVINPATREWKDGLFSCIMRDMANITHDGPKWILLDGDIDPMWIESLNTVMDDNKVLTLASNERIPLNNTMRLLFEISNLKTATPATVSRAGILFLNPADLGWNPIMTSWIETREHQSERANMMILMEKYIPPCLEALRTKFKTITPIPDTAYLHMLCYLLEGLMTEDNVPEGSPKDIYELYFVWACVWAFGGSLFQDQICDHRVEFTKWWAAEFKQVKFPSQGTVFDYFIEPEQKKFCHWSEMAAECTFKYDPERPLQATMVPTAETTRVRFWMDMLMEKRRPVMLIGNAGSGKTVLVQSKLDSLNPENYVVGNVPFNFYTTSLMLQGILEAPLEKKAGRNYGPPGSKKLVYFIDDMNMPEVDTYFTVQPHTLIRQHMDYSHWYDRTKLSLKEIHNCQYVACMNPTAGSFTINSRLQRHFSVFAVSFPGLDALESIYKQIFEQHLTSNKFNANIVKNVETLVKSALQVHTQCTTSFLPTAVKFHYIFNLRDLSNIFQGVLFSSPEVVKDPLKMTRLYMHEATRVYCDKMTEKRDQEQFNEIMTGIIAKDFGDMNQDELFAMPNNFCHFAKGIGEPKYDSIASWDGINQVLVEALDNYNDLNAAMNLVLFEDAMSHILRINRILEMPRGNALLVGVGGSGKQSLSRLAAYICGLDVFQIQLRKGYSIADLKVDLGAQYFKAGVKNQPVMFLMTDAQVPQEEFLVLINDLLASGEIPGLFPDDQIEEVISGVRNEVKATGQEDSRENCWKFFIENVRRKLKVVLCFSPVGTTLRVRSRKFPALVNCTSIDWFHEWPQEALRSVSLRFLNDIEEVPQELKGSVSEFMSFVHTTVNNLSGQYLTNDRRYNYTTPKSFLEQIKLYENLLKVKKVELLAKMERLENGLQKLQSTAAQVDDLKLKLAAQEVELKQKNEDADKLIEKVGVETLKVTKEKEFADGEEAKVAVIAHEVGIKAADCERDLAAAEPALLAAQAALDTLNKNNLTELKSFGSPPNAVVKVVSAVICLLAPKGKVPKDRSWKAAKSGVMAKVDKFLDDLIFYDKENIHEACLKAVQPYLDDPEFDPEFIRAKSSAAAGMCAWVINIVLFYRVFCDVEPKRNALAQANADLAAAQEKLTGIKAKIKELDDNLQELTDEFQQATDEKLRCQKEAESTQLTISLANRLVGGLASENVRWAEAVEEFKRQETKLPGDVLLITAFVSYFGYFTKPYRTKMMDGTFLPFMKTQETVIPITEDLDAITMLTDDADVAQWNNEGLPADRMSKENATILCNCERWPLMVDPQLQGIKWIKQRYESRGLKVVRLGQRGYLDMIEQAVSNGDVVLIENLGEQTDPVLDPLLGRNTIKKGKFIKIGDKEVDYHPQFKLILHTKLANPHYQPEMQAQCTLINFTVTRDGLEDQLLADVVRAERPDLEELKAELTTQQNEFKIILKRLEDDLLARLSAASGNFLGDTALVENLETTKRTATEIEEKVKEAKITEQKINEAREWYRPGAGRASLLYFILDDLNKIHPMYQFSLKAFNVVFAKSIERAEKSDDVKARVNNLIDSVTYSVYIYATRGLFERDKLTFTAQVAFQVLQNRGEIDGAELDFLLRFPAKADQGSPNDFISNNGWGGVKTLSDMEAFRGLDRDIEGSANRWKKFIESECPEKEKFPGEWKNKTSLQKLCMMRCFRPDRMTYAVTAFIEEKLHPKYVENRSVPFATSFEETGPGTPVFFILSPGVDPLKDVEAVGKNLGFTFDNRNFHNVSLGQGQEIVAEEAMQLAAREGHWVILQNIHLVAKWLPALEKALEKYATGSDPRFRMFVSAEPAGTRAGHIIPQGILESSIKITNEPPTGILANLHKALDNFDQNTLEMCSRENEFKSILNSLCYFHAVVCERRKFGPQGWNRSYPFNVGDLTISCNVLYNYLEANSKVPWDDLRYLFGEIMYGGHITDDWDRKLCRTYLLEYMHPDQLEGELFLAPGYAVPPNSDYKGYHLYIDENLPPESPYLYGLHPNAEIGVLTQTSEELFKTLLEMQPKDSGGGGGGTMSMEDKVKAILDEITEKLPEEFNLYELNQKVEEITPYVVVALQECERMNTLITEMRTTLKACALGLKGELTITSAMEGLMNALFIDSVPGSWSARAFPSMLGLTAWYADLLQRIKELENWTGDFQMPACLWLGGLFNPQSLLTAIMQSMARKNEWPLDKMALQCDVTKKSREDMNAPPREGAYISGLFMEGARWDTQQGSIAESKLKELTPAMPVLFIKAIPIDRLDQKGIYECPVYKTRDRGPTFVWTFNLKTKESANKWILGGVALLLQD